ncbi:MAG: hypothetical protein LBC41_00825, partial [Clostridiales bacterium]|nr:hypothetical protein [Clostridiales bacterium]
MAAICTETSGQLFKLPLPVAMGEGIYRSLTCDQKMLYALLLSKHSLSQRRDASNEPFLILPRTEMIEAVGMAINTATRAMRALASAGLLREKHQGNGEPNRIYLTEFLDPEMRRFFMIPASLYGTGAPEMSSVEKMAICYLCHKRLLQGNEECIEHGLHKVECTRQELAPVLSVNLRGVF